MADSANTIEGKLEQASLNDELELVCNGVDLVEKGKVSNFYVSIVPPNKGPRRDTVYINVVDVSGSMQLAAMNEQTEGDFLYSRLDLVKYSLENIVENCEENDYFALVIFSDNAEVVLPITRMDADGKKLAKKKIYEQNVKSSTNLWSGIEAGLGLAKDEICNNKNVSMIVLTDGVSNLGPSVFKALESYLEKNHIICSINTLGFGYDIDAQLLYDIALKLGSGTYCFIPDCTMIGTNVTSLIAKNKSCFAKNATLKITIEGAKWKPDFHHFLDFNTNLYKKNILCDKDDHEFVLDFGVIDYGQQRDIVLGLKNLSKNTIVKAEVTYNICSSIQTLSKMFVLSEITGKNQEIINAINHRNLFINAIFDLIKIRTETNNEAKETKEVKACKNKLLDVLKKDKDETFVREFENNVREFEGQVAKAFERKDWFKKWGISHALYLVSSHLRRFNANFKDPSVQKYGGEIFEQHRDACENIFCTLQQPKPSIQNYSAKAGGNGQQISIAQACCNIAAGCFTGESEILMSNGEIKKVCELLPGDELQSWNNKTCKIKCVIRTRCIKPIEIINLNGLKITPYHPVFINNWEFPINISKAEIIPCSYVYNLVVDSEHVVIINGIKCVTLGHDYQENIVAHPYFGSQKVIDDIKLMKGWTNGYIRIECLLVTRDENTGLINSMIQAEYHDDVKLNCNKYNAEMEMSY